LIIFW